VPSWGRGNTRGVLFEGRGTPEGRFLRERENTRGTLLRVCTIFPELGK